jgi:hypothetical protein
MSLRDRVLAYECKGEFHHARKVRDTSLISQDCTKLISPDSTLNEKVRFID